MLSNEKSTNKKGVNVSIENESDSDANQLKKELQAAIETMGPDTPHLNTTITIEDTDISTVSALSENEPKSKYSVGNETNISELYMVQNKSFTSDSSKVGLESADDVSNLDLTILECLECCLEEGTQTNAKCQHHQPLPYGHDKGSSTKPQVHLCRDCRQRIFEKNNNNQEVENYCKCRQKWAKGGQEESFPCHVINRLSRFDKNKIYNWFKNRGIIQHDSNNRQEFYKMHLSQPEGDNSSPPRKLVFDLVDELPKPPHTTVATNTSKEFQISNNQISYKHSPVHRNGKEMKDMHNERTRYLRTNDNSIKDFKTIEAKNENVESKLKNKGGCAPGRVDVYYFDHGNAAYLRTTDNLPLIKAEMIADKSEDYTMKFWAEVFGSIHIGMSFVTSFILQLLRFLLQSLLRPLTVGLIQLTSDYFFKPFIATLFNGVVQPPLIFCYNICTSCRDICDPLAEGMGYFIRECAVCIRACRIIEIKQAKSCSHSHQCMSEESPIRNQPCSAKNSKEAC